MVEYNVELQRQQAIQQLTAKRETVRVKGLIQCSNDSLMPFNKFCVFANSLGSSTDGLDMFCYLDSSAIKFAAQYLKLTEWIARLKAGEDPRTILLEIVSTA